VPAASNLKCNTLPRVTCADAKKNIHVRPPEVEGRVMPGHWEGDFIKAAGNKSSVGVLVERSSRLVPLAKREHATAASALAGFTAKLSDHRGNRAHVVGSTDIYGLSLVVLAALTLLASGLGRHARMASEGT
jgi:IS30 family transposase